MLTPAQVLPFLQHEDRDVRKHAADYLIEAHDPAPATCDDLWAAIDRFGANDALVMVRALAALPQTENSYQRLLDALRTETNEDVAAHLQNAAEELDYGLLDRHRDEVLSAEQIKPEVRDHLRQRLKLAHVPVDQLWDRLMQEGQEAGVKTVGQFDHRVSWRLIQALSPHTQFAGERALAVLRDPNVEDWREIFCVDLIGLAKYRPAVDTLIEKYLIDADVLRESVGDALMRLGDDEVIAKLEAFIPGKAWDVRLYALNAFERIKLPASEAALIRLIPGEESPDLRTDMGAGLCMLCTTEGLDLVRQLILSDLYDPQMADLREMLMTAGKMVGYEPPEAERWRRQIAEERAQHARMFPDVAGIFGNVLGGPTAGGMAGEIRFGNTQPNLIAPPRVAAAKAPPPRGASLPIARAAPVPTRVAPKVGRNDPCPCGSGKKYKKCHGK